MISDIELESNIELESDEELDDNENSNQMSNYSYFYETKESEALIKKQKQKICEIYSQIINKENVNKILSMKQVVNEIDISQVIQQTENIISSICTEVQEDLMNLANGFKINSIKNTFELLFQYDNEFKKVICYIFKQILKNKLLIYDIEKVLFDIYVNLIKRVDESNSQFQSSSWIYGNKNLIIKTFEDLESKMKQQGHEFSGFPLLDIIQDINLDEVDEYMNINDKLSEQIQLNMLPFIDVALQFETQQQLIDFMMMIDQIEREILKNPPNMILILILYKKIQLAHKSVIQQTIENQKINLTNQIFQKLYNVQQKMSNLNNKIEIIKLNQIQERLIEFINDYYLGFQIRQYIKKIQCIIEELQKHKINENEIEIEQSDSTTLKYIINLVPHNFQQQFMKIMTKKAVSILKTFLLENKLTQIKDIIQQKQLLLIMCQQISLKLFPQQFKEKQFLIRKQKILYNNFTNLQKNQQSQQRNRYQQEQKPYIQIYQKERQQSSKNNQRASMNMAQPPLSINKQQNQNNIQQNQNQLKNGNNNISQNRFRQLKQIKS